MEYLIGVVTAVLVCAFALLVGFDRDRAFYPTVLVVVATYYILFAALGNSTSALTAEGAAAVVFVVLAVVGFRGNFWIVPAGLVGHGVFDCVHYLLIQNPGLPAWWPGFCLSYDIVAGVLLAVLMMKRPGYTPKKPA